MTRPLVLLTLGLAACAGGGLACTEVGCSGSLVIDATGLTDGLWDLALTTDQGEVIQCTFQLPGAEAGTCTGDLLVTLADLDGGVTVVVQTNMTDGAPFTSIGLTATDADGGVLGADVTPAWEGPVYPNGEACDAPVGCWSAEAAVTLTPPPLDG